MAIVSLRAVERTPKGKGGVRKLRRGGMVPAVLYGIGVDSVPLSVDENDLNVMFRRHGGSSIIVDLRIEGEKSTTGRALVKDVQRHTVTGRVLHLDLQRVSAKRKLTVDVPIILVGEAKGVKEGGVMETIQRDIQVHCLPADIPEKVEIDISEMGIGDSVHIRDLEIPNAEILADPDGVVVTLVPPTVYEEVKVEEEVAAEEEEPELVKEEKEKAEAGEEEKPEGKDKQKE